jgi:hypothetical protein
MNQEHTKAATHSVALIAMYLMNGYEAEARASSGSQLQELSGHLAVADEFARIASAIHEHLETEALPVGIEYPGVLEYEVVEPLGKWLHANSMCTPEQACAEFARRFQAWLEDEPREADLNTLELARQAVDARSAYKVALRELEVATSGREGGWPRFRRNRVEEFIDTIGVLVEHRSTSPLQTLIAIANGSR